MFLLMLLSEQCYSQTYSYSFLGEISITDQQSLQKEVSQLPGVNSYEIKIKPDSKKGEIIFSLSELEITGENKHPFSPIDLKSLMIQFKLEPIDFRQIK